MQRHAARACGVCRTESATAHGSAVRCIRPACELLAGMIAHTPTASSERSPADCPEPARTPSSLFELVPQRRPLFVSALAATGLLLFIVVSRHLYHQRFTLG